MSLPEANHAAISVTGSSASSITEKDRMFAYCPGSAGGGLTGRGERGRRRGGRRVGAGGGGWGGAERERVYIMIETKHYLAFLVSE